MQNVGNCGFLSEAISDMINWIDGNDRKKFEKIYNNHFDLSRTVMANW